MESKSFIKNYDYIVSCIKLKKQPPEVFYKKKLFLNISQYLQETNVLASLLTKFRPVTLLKRDLNTDIFLWISQNIANIETPVLKKHLQTAASQVTYHTR